ncbi:hypothetical protein [Limnoglobus roseus]|uniref:GNAT family N-acetyltransferase n=1 Tax=Limnoglobus roseus TaxID=2598579 RepID=A0A5C1AE64_9BACT|nr:hypothetical protein [Limnoglobus roseus]QEL16002.1 hypothetical protein PX52LOC_02940 [Limnoglobus roseus]
MLQIGAYCFKQALSPQELEQVHRLNYQTFVQEIPQHADTGTGQLVDKFHEKNRYLICLKDNELVGMISWCDQPPFSIASRLPDPSILEQPGLRPVEIRLMAVVPTERNSLVLPGLVWALFQQSKTMPWTHFVISGVVEQRELHTHLGFEPLGPPIGTGRAQFTPMWLPVGKLDETMGRSMQLWQKRLERSSRTQQTA